MIVEYELDGIAVNPVDRHKIYIEVNHDQESVIDQPRPHVGINNLSFAREDVERIMDRLNNPPGITEGVPFNIKIKERNIIHIIQMYVDMMSDGFNKSRDGANTGIKMLQSHDWLDDKVDAFTFESMYNETNVAPFIIDSQTFASYKQFFDQRQIYIPYVISSIPNWHDAFLAIFTCVYVVNELAKNIKEITQWLTPSAGVGATVHVGQLVVQIAYSILLLVTLIALITQLINCLVQPVKYHGAMLMSDLLKVTAAKLGLKSESSIWDQAPYNQIAYLPEKYNPLEGNGSSFSLLGYQLGGFGTKGYTSPTPAVQRGYYNGTGGDFLRFIKTYCNGKIIIPDQTNKLVLERRDYYPSNTPFQLKDIRQDWNGYNTDELIANIVIKFQVDLNDKNCTDHVSLAGVPFYTGTVLEATHQQVTVTNQALVLLKGLLRKDIAAARGATKEELNFIEKAVKAIEPIWASIVNSFIAILDALITALNVAIAILNAVIAVLNAIILVIVSIVNVVLSIIDAIASLFGGSGPKELDVDDFQIPNIPSIPLIEFLPLTNDFGNNRIGALLLENDMVDTPKLLLINTARPEFTSQRIAYIHPDNASTVHAKHLWDKFYFIDAFVDPSNSNNKCNRFTKISPALNNPEEKNKTTLSLADFRNLVSNPQFKDNWNEDVIADSIQWYPEQNGAAEFQFRKQGWLRKPQHPNAVARAQEIAINLNIKISIPSGQ